MYKLLLLSLFAVATGQDNQGDLYSLIGKDAQQSTPQPQSKGCGWRYPGGVGLQILGDTVGEAGYGEFPWVVAIVKFGAVDLQGGPESNVYIGVGSLIHPSVVLTAAHVVRNMSSLFVRAGEWDTQTVKEIYPHQDRHVESMVIHKDFNGGNLFYDIAVLFLSKPMDLAANVGIVCLPPPRERVPGSTQCFSSWWRKEDFEKGSILNKVETSVVDRNSCQSAIRKSRLGQFFELHTSFMCTGEGTGDDICKSAGGSPLACPIEFENGRYMQSGIIAFNVGCGKDMLVVYADVSNLRDWIDDKVKGKGYNTRAYSFNI